MHAFLIISADPIAASQKAQSLAAANHATLMPFTLQKISDVRDLSQYTKLSLQSPTAFYIEHIDSASIDAVNAFLKQLEEPGENMYYILTASSEEKVLPTIVSRCQVIRVHSSLFTVHRMEDTLLIKKSLGEQLQIIDKIKKRDEAITFIQNLIRMLHHELISPTVNRELITVNHLTIAQHTLTALEKNGNVTSQLTRMVVGWNKENSHLTLLSEPHFGYNKVT